MSKYHIVGNHMSGTKIVEYCKFRNFCEGFIFAKLHLCVRENKILAKCQNHSIVTDIYINHALVAIFNAANMHFNAIRKNKILAKIS